MQKDSSSQIDYSDIICLLEETTEYYKKVLEEVSGDRKMTISIQKTLDRDMKLLEQFKEQQNNL